MNKNSSHPLDYIDINSYLSKEFNIIVNESDRGCILLCSSILEHTLKEQFIKILPNEIKNDKDIKNKLLHNSFDKNLNQAFLCRYIPFNIFEAINKLKSIRNKIAHNKLDFELSKHREKISEISELTAKGGAYYFSKVSLEIHIANIVKTLLNNNTPSEFKTFEEILDYIKTKKEFHSSIELKALKIELSLSTLVLISCINFHFEEALTLLEGEKTISQIKKT